MLSILHGWILRNRINVLSFISKNQCMIFNCVSLGFFIMGMIMLILGWTADNFTRIYIAALCFGSGFAIIPILSINQKDKLLKRVFMHLVLNLFLTFVLILLIEYMVQNIITGKFYYDILFCLCGAIVSSYLIYILSLFLKWVYLILKKIIVFIFPLAENKHSGVINLLSCISSLLIALGALFASAISVVDLVLKLVEIIN